MSNFWDSLHRVYVQIKSTPLLVCFFDLPFSETVFFVLNKTIGWTNDFTRTNRMVLALRYSLLYKVYCIRVMTTPPTRRKCIKTQHILILQFARQEVLLHSFNMGRFRQRYDSVLHCPAKAYLRGRATVFFRNFYEKRLLK